jgi:hypothetical protein
MATSGTNMREKFMRSRIENILELENIVENVGLIILIQIKFSNIRLMQWIMDS